MVLFGAVGPSFLVSVSDLLRADPLMSQHLELLRYVTITSFTVVRMRGGWGGGAGFGLGQNPFAGQDPADSRATATEFACSQSLFQVDWQLNVPAMVPVAWIRQA